MPSATVRKFGHTYAFAWPVGREVEILDEISAAAQSPLTNIDYYDAGQLFAAVGHQTTDPDLRVLCGVDPLPAGGGHDVSQSRLRNP